MGKRLTGEKFTVEKMLHGENYKRGKVLWGKIKWGKVTPWKSILNHKKLIL